MSLSEYLIPFETPDEWREIKTDNPELRAGNRTLMIDQDSGMKRVCEFEWCTAIQLIHDDDPPYQRGPDGQGDTTLFMVVENSRWIDRHLTHAFGKYESNRKVIENRVQSHKRLLKHYVIQFYDHRVEAIAEGIWVTVSEQKLDLDRIPPLGRRAYLEEDAEIDTFQAEDKHFSLRRNSSEIDILAENARFCTQRIYECYVTDDGPRPYEPAAQSWVTIRNVHGKVFSEIAGGRIQMQLVEGVVTQERFVRMVQKSFRGYKRYDR